ncbi:MAG: hypothetical protein ACTSWR_09145 [Candidatus Helarchaeota archaeon]
MKTNYYEYNLENDYEIYNNFYVNELGQSLLQNEVLSDNKQDFVKVKRQYKSKISKKSSGIVDILIDLVVILISLMLFTLLSFFLMI